MIERRRRISAIVLICMFIAGGTIYKGISDQQQARVSVEPQVAGVATASDDNSLVILATEVLDQLEIKGRAPKTGYSRAQFDDGWQDVGDCDVRNVVLARDMEDVVVVSDTDCTVLSGTLDDPYTGKTIQFKRGPKTSDDVQIEHVVALSDAWQKGAQLLSSDRRLEFANDMLNLLAVDGPTNQKKSDSDAATWLPPNKAYRCRYIARQIAVKQKYTLWVTEAEHAAMSQTLKTCPTQPLPLITSEPKETTNP